MIPYAALGDRVPRPRPTSRASKPGRTTSSQISHSDTDPSTLPQPTRTTLPVLRDADEPAPIVRDWRIGAEAALLEPSGDPRRERVAVALGVHLTGLGIRRRERRGSESNVVSHGGVG